MREVQLESNLPSGFQQRRYLARKLKHTAGHDAHSERSGDVAKHGAKEGERDHRQIQQNRSECGRTKFVKTIEYPHRKGRDAYQEDVGEYDPVERSRKFELSGCIAKSRSKQPHNDGGQHDARDCKDRKNNCDYGQHRVGEFKRFVFFVFGEVSGKHGYESGTNGAFAHQPPEHVRNSICGRVGVGGRACAEKKGNAGVAEVTKNPAENRECADE